MKRQIYLVALISQTSQPIKIIICVKWMNGVELFQVSVVGSMACFWGIYTLKTDEPPRIQSEDRNLISLHAEALN